MVLQIGTSILALPVLFWFSWRYYLLYRQHLKVSSKIKTYFWILFGLAFLAGAWSVYDYLSYFKPELISSELYFFTGKSINEFSQASLAIFSLGCILFLILDRKHLMD